jgi:hypothetical protein
MSSAGRAIRRPGARTALALLAVLGVTGCGEQQPSPPPSHEVDLTKLGSPPPAAKQQPVTIDRPNRERTLAATVTRDGRAAFSATVAGRAQPFQSIRVMADCALAACTRYVTSTGDGQWRVRLDLVLHPRRSILLSADYALPHGGDTGSRVRIRLTTPQPKRSTASHAVPMVPQAPSSTPPASAPRSLILIGDSLAVGIRPLLPALLPGWKLTIDGRVGRPLAEGMNILARTQLPSDGSTVLAISLFTNDDPTHLAALGQAVQTTLARVGPRGCVIWATIASHPVGGVTYAKANALLDQRAAQDPRLQLVPWARAVQQDPGLLGPDHVHPTPQGYQLRAELYAQAAERCG